MKRGGDRNTSKKKRFRCKVNKFRTQLQPPREDKTMVLIESVIKERLRMPVRSAIFVKKKIIIMLRDH